MRRIALSKTEYMRVDRQAKLKRLSRRWKFVLLPPLLLTAWYLGSALVSAAVTIRKLARSVAFYETFLLDPYGLHS
jgi:hypothetical protein